jgi:ABC-type multidrug transport system ATPase subunit
MTGLRVEGIRKSYSSQVVVNDVSFMVAPREIVGFVGPNGAGKSTTLRILTGLLAPDAGRVSLDDIDLHAQPRAFRQRLGVLIDSPAVYPMLTAVDHLQYVGRLRGLPNRGQIEDTLNAVGLDARSTKRVGQFSLGMKQRLGIAMAIFARPSLLVLDEPMNGLDPMGIAELRAFLRSLPDRLGSSVLVSSHMLSEIEQTCHRVLFLREGRLIADTPLDPGDSASAFSTVWVRTGNDALALQLLQQAPFVLEAVKVAGRGISCRIPTVDLGAIAPLMVEHAVPLLELTGEKRQLEHAYLAHFSAGKEKHLA